MVNFKPMLKGNQYKVYKTIQQVDNQMYMGQPLIVRCLHNGLDNRNAVQKCLFLLVTKGS